MEWASILLFAMALSLDGFGVGISYGMRGIRIPVFSLLVISLTSAGAISLSMLGGHLLSRFISMEAAEIIGAAILILVGVWIIYQAGRAGVGNNNNGNGPDAPDIQELFKIKLRPLGLVIQIIKEPVKADIDKSGIISGQEAFLLGLALAMDALGAGFGAAMAGFKPLITPLFVGIAKFTMVGVGDFVGRRYAATWISNKAAAIPGWVLVGLGIIRVFKL